MKNQTNKYLESYQRLTNRIYKYDHIEEVYKDLEVLGELVEKATPKKPIKHDKPDPKYGTIYSCPNCHLIFLGLHGKYCYHCGQALDWGEEDE